MNGRWNRFVPTAAPVRSIPTLTRLRVFNELGAGDSFLS
jgi:hypothetical protein